MFDSAIFKLLQIKSNCGSCEGAKSMRNQVNKLNYKCFREPHSIPVGTTQPERHEISLFFRFFISLKPSSRLNISLAASLIRVVRYENPLNVNFSGYIESMIWRFSFIFLIHIICLMRKDC